MADAASRVTQRHREVLKGHRAFVLWLTGLSGSGKTTLAVELERTLFEQRVHTALLDGDVLRRGLSRDLGFSDDDRREQIRRVGEAARLIHDAGLVVLVALISPFRAPREEVRRLFEPGRFLEVFVDCPLNVCEERDPKGLYRRAHAGELLNFTGLSSPYEPPLNPDIHLPTDKISVEEAVAAVLSDVKGRRLLSPLAHDAATPGAGSGDAAE